MLAGITLTRSLFHPVWFLLILAGLVFFQRDEWKKTLLLSAIPLLLVFSWPVKNAVLFGEFGNSTWLGMSLSKMVTDGTSPDEMERLVAEHDLSPILAEMEFEPADTYFPYIGEPEKTGVAALDQVTKSTGYPNMNHIALIKASEEYGEGVRRLFPAEPGLYFRSVWRATLLYFKPAGEYLFTAHNTQKIRVEVALFNALLYGRFGKHPFLTPSGEVVIPPPGERLTGLPWIGFWIPLVFIGALGFAVLRAWKLLRVRQHPRPQDAVSFFLVFIMLWVTVFGIACDVGENFRFRYAWEPFYFVFVGMFFSWVLRKFRIGHSSKESFSEPG